MTVTAHINSVPNGSTGGIMLAQHHELLARGERSYAFWGRRFKGNNVDTFNFGSRLNFLLDVALTYCDGFVGFHSRIQTKRLLKRLDEIQPDVVRLHNLHGYYLNLNLLFNWLSVHECNVVWTLHDCWAFTGHCPYFTAAKCYQWESCCCEDGTCSQLRSYPPTFAGSRSVRRMFQEKKKLFTLLPENRLKLIVPSQWLADLVSRSFLSKYEIEVQNNKIDHQVFRPILSDFRQTHGVGNRFMVLGVACPWTERKGLAEFIRLASELDSDKFAVVLIGLSEKQIKSLSGVLIALPKTESRERLAEAYSAADVYVNPSIEETFGMTVAEAQACGTHVVVMEDSACAEIADPIEATVIPSGYCNLKAAITELYEKRAVL